MGALMQTPATEYLGARRSTRGVPPRPAKFHVYVVWLDSARDLLHSIMSLAVHGFACPECGTVWPITRDRGLAHHLSRHGAHAVLSTSDSCPNCPTIVHFDRTDPARQMALKWPREFDYDGDDVAQRAARGDGSRWVRLGGSSWRH